MIRNKSKNTVIARNFVKKTFLGKLNGLMGKKTPKAMIFKTRFGIHTFFLNFPIDVVIVDKNKKIVAVKESLKPNRVLFWNIKYDTVIELPFGSLEKSKTLKGDFLQFNL